MTFSGKSDLLLTLNTRRPFPLNLQTLFTVNKYSNRCLKIPIDSRQLIDVLFTYAQVYKNNGIKRPCRRLTFRYLFTSLKKKQEVLQ